MRCLTEGKMEFQIFKNFPVTAAVSERTGGVSVGQFASNNMSFSTGDDAAHILSNRRKFLSALLIAPEQIISTNQVHGTNILIVGKEDRGRGALTKETAIPACDGLLTKETNVALTMNFADCTPIFLYDPVHRIAGLLHGGWRGTAGNICGKAVAMAEEIFSSRASDILAAIGPCIRRQSFEVGEDVIVAFSELFSPSEMETLSDRKENGKYHFDLPHANRLLLLRAGLRVENIEDCGICTFERDDLFYSYRKSGGQTGRHMGVIMMRNE